MDVVAHIEQLGGAVRTRDLVALGYKASAFRAALRAGHLLSPRRGVIALATLPSQSVAAIAAGGVLTCVSALSQWGLPLLTPRTDLHVDVPRHFSGAQRVHDPVTFHYVRRPLLSAVARPARVLDVMGHCASDLDHLIAIDAALHAGLVSPAEIAAFTSTPPQRIRWLLAHADGRAESLLETVTRQALGGTGLPVRPQAFIPGVGRLDFLVADAVVVEADGREPHDTTDAFTRDRARDRALTLRGYGVLRYTYADLIGPRARDIAGEVRRAVELVRARPSRGRAA